MSKGDRSMSFAEYVEWFERQDLAKMTGAQKESYRIAKAEINGKG